MSKTPGGHSTFFSGRGVRPGFPKCGVCELIFASDREGACELKISKLGACGLKVSKFWGLRTEKISKFGGLRAKNWAKIKAVKAKISKFLKRGSFELTHLLEMGLLRTTGEAWKGGLQGRTSPYPLSWSVIWTKLHELVFEILLFGRKWKYGPKLFFKT